MKPEELLYAKTHEWVYIEDDGEGGKLATIGLSAFAVEALTDLVFMELPEVGREVHAGESFGEIESVKAVSDIYAPIDGTIAAVNAGLPDDLEALSSDPYGGGWMVKICIADAALLSGLVDYAAYQTQCQEEL